MSIPLKLSLEDADDLSRFIKAAVQSGSPLSKLDEALFPNRSGALRQALVSLDTLQQRAQMTITDKICLDLDDESAFVISRMALQTIDDNGLALRHLDVESLGRVTLPDEPMRLRNVFSELSAQLNPKLALISGRQSSN